MKKLMKRLTCATCCLTAFVTAFGFAGCSGSEKDDSAIINTGNNAFDFSASDGGDVSPTPVDPSYGDSAPDSGVPDDSFGFEISDGGSTKPEGGESGATSPDTSGSGGSGSSSGSGGVQAPIVKQLTGAVWNDAQNYDFWLKLFEKEIYDENQKVHSGIFSNYSQATRGLDSFEMHEVYVTCGENAAVNASVTLYSDNEAVYSAVTDSAGRAYVFGSGTQVKAESGEAAAYAEVTDGVINVELPSTAAFENEMEIMLVVDTTGSMGDELSFLCNELAGVITRVSSTLDCDIRLGLLFYRDEGDKYVTRFFDFAEVNSETGLNAAINNLKAQSSAGGGDYPEAVDTALSEAVEANWHTNSKTKLLFQILDAPYHDVQKNRSVFANAVTTAAQKGIRIIPVAASGLDNLGQFIMRSAALMTGGTYTFLTDDSGIGLSHTLPAVGEFTVEYLSDLMVRLMKGYYTGEFDEPVNWKQAT